MPQTENGKISYQTALRIIRINEIANTFEWLIVAFVLVLFFRTFILEPYRIPTGSMADTLRGDHFRLRCVQCGYKYNFGFVPERYGLLADSTYTAQLSPIYSRCPSCGFHQQTGGEMPVVNGDRILVLKCVYQFFQPKRWDVIVFKNPLEPSVNYIKRLIALPGETVEIIDGDIYINGLIERKPQKVQNQLWMPVYDNDYQPVRPGDDSFNGHIWQRPFKNDLDSNWTIQKDNETKFNLDCSTDQIHTLIYDTSIGNDFRAAYAYDDVDEFEYMPYCSDLKVRFYAEMNEPYGCVGITLSKYQTIYRAWFDSDGKMTIEAVGGDATQILARSTVGLPVTNKPILVTFENLDHQLIFQFGNEKLTFDLGRFPEDVGSRETDVQPKVKIFGSGKLAISHVAVFRDIHYNNAKFRGSLKPARATEGNPMTLAENEFFVLGDNSPDSHDSRLWDQPGRGNNSLFYRHGIVPREYLIGEALLVYWPGGFRAFHKSRFAVIPDIDQIRFVCGGSDKNP